MMGEDEINSKATDDENDVIEMEQENGLPVEKSVVDDKKDETPKASGPALVTMQHQSAARKVFCGLMAVVLGIGLVLGGIFVGRLVQKHETSENGSETNPVSASLLGGGGGMPVSSMALMPQDDKLALAFLKLHNTRDNSCYSPLSVRYALEMIREGASGETKTQIDSLLGNIKATKYKTIAEHLGMGNAIWVRESWKDNLKPEFQGVLKNTTGADLITDDFTSAENINAWVTQNTLGLVEDLLSDKDVQSLSALVINALAINMEWASKYAPEMTAGHFFDFDNLQIEAEDDLMNDKYLYTTMSRSGGKDIYYNLAAEATVLAQDLKEYDGTKLQFVAIMPKEDLTSYIENVDIAAINQLLSNLRIAIPQNDTYLFSFMAYIPKFSMEGGIDDLTADLRELGVTDAFDAEKADFTTMTDDDSFAIMEMKQKTKFDFSEDGIKAAAVTLGGFGGAGGPGPIPSSVNIVVSINKPFMYLVRDTKTGEIWFSGTVYEPNHWVDDQAQYTWH